MFEKSNANKPKLTEGKIFLQLFELTLPIVFLFFSFVAFNLVDTYFIAQLGTNELAAMSFTFPVVAVLASVATGLGVGTSSVIARVIGEGNRQKVQRLTTDSLLLSLLIAIILAFGGLATINPLFTALGARQDLLPLIGDYMNTWYLGVVFFVVFIVGNSAICASGNTAVPGLIMALSVATNTLLDPLLIFGWGLFPALGMKGAALATTIAKVGTLIASLAFLHCREHLLVLNFPSLKGMVKNWRSLLSVGLPATATKLISPLSVGLVTNLIARYGASAVASFGLASQLEGFALIVPLALSVSLGPFVGQNWGAQQYSRVKHALQLSFWFCLSWGALVAVLLGTAAPEIVAWFDSDPAVVASTTVYLKLVPISYGALGIVITASSAFNALGKPLPALGISMVRLLLFYIPLTYLGSRLFGLFGIFGAACLSNAIVGLAVWLWALLNKRKFDEGKNLETGV